MPKVTLIVPVYNAEKNIVRCVESVLGQDFEDYEAIFVDDGSKDNSGSILDEYAAKDERIRVIHKENGGVSVARNTALDQARGEYIQFMDADDWLPTDSMKMLVRSMEQNQCDLVIADFYRVVGEKLSRRGSIYNDQPMTNKEFAEYMMESPADYYYGVLWNKLFKRSIIEQHHLRLEEKLNWCEDFVFNLDYIVHAKTIVALQVPVYYYVKTEGSLISQSMRLGTIVRMKTNIFQYYNQFFKDVLDEKEYNRARGEIASFLFAYAGDEVLFPFLPGHKKVGEESVIVTVIDDGRNDFFSSTYYINKIFDRYLNTVGMQYGLDLKDVKVFMALQTTDTDHSIKELMDITGYTQINVISSLERLFSKRYVAPKIEGLSITYKIDEDRSKNLYAACEQAIKDAMDVCFRGLSEQERADQLNLFVRMSANIKEKLLSEKTE